MATGVALDQFERVWMSLSSADRMVLLGHDGDALTAPDKIKLAAISRRASWRSGGRPRRG